MKHIVLKVCKTCKESKQLDSFYGRQGSCKICYNLSRKPYRQANKERYRQHGRQWAESNQERIVELRKNWYSSNSEYNHVYYEKNKEQLKLLTKQYRIKRQKTDLSYKIAIVLRKRLSSVIKNNQKAGSAVKDLGCSVQELKTHLESKFQPGMTWNNWGFQGWHIDHIVPLCSFDLSNREQLLKACHYTNLQPLWAKDNLSKGGRYRS